MYSTLKRSTKPMKRVSDKRAALEAAREECRKAVHARDQRCQFPVFLGRYIHEYGMFVVPGSQRCFGALTVHEPAHRRNVDITDPDNCLLLCSYHNEWCEDFPVVARLIGLSVEGNGFPIRHVRVVR
jgi:hypothetical protein